MRILVGFLVLLISCSSFSESPTHEGSAMPEAVAEALNEQENNEQVNVAAINSESEAVQVNIPQVQQPQILKESEIPVLTSAKAKKVEEKTSFTRVILSLLVIAILAGGLLYFSKWYAKNNAKNSETTKIRVLTQHFLGPRKSLAIVRVAGETILIGVTDQNISMIKSLSLIDDEFPDTVSNNFENSLKSADERSIKTKNVSAAEEETEDFVISSIKDKVSTKIRNMRNI